MGQWGTYLTWVSLTSTWGHDSMQGYSEGSVERIKGAVHGVVCAALSRTGQDDP